LLLERGCVEMIGEPGQVGARYLERNFAGEPRGSHDGDATRIGDRRIEILDAWFEEGGQRVEILHQGATCTFCMRVRCNEAVSDPILAFLIENDRHDPLFAISNEDGQTPTGKHEAGDEAVLSVSFVNVFAPGRVHVTPWVLHSSGAAIMDRRERFTSVIVTAVHVSGGVVDLPARMHYERGVRETA
jgi:hypothetical protein